MKTHSILCLVAMLAFVPSVGCDGPKEPEAEKRASPKIEAQAPPKAEKAPPKIEVEVKKMDTKGHLVSFPDHGIRFAVPQGWKTMDAAGLETNVLPKSGQEHADKYVKGQAKLSCFLRRKTPPGAAICIIPGSEYVKGVPKTDILRAGTISAACVHASYLAWLAAYDKDRPEPGGRLWTSSQRMLGKKVYAPEIRGESVHLIGMVLKDTWPGKSVTLGLAAPPDDVPEVVKAVEQIVREIDKHMKPK